MNDLTELIKLIESHIFEDKSFGTYRVLPTGKLMPTDKTYIEVLINGKSSYAKPCMPFGMYRVPSEKWLAAHKGKIIIWVTFENGNPAHPVWIGMCPLDNKIPDNKNYPDVAVFTTEKFIFEFDDINEYCKVTDKNGKGWVLGGTASDKAAEPMVLGDKNGDLLKNILTRIEELEKAIITFATTQNTASASMSILAPLTAGYAKLITDATSEYAEVVKLEADIAGTKSTKLTLD